jgi:ABC-2 type transport system ATP-binding protein
MNNIIETVSLNFSYGKNQILKNVALQVPKGSIYGLLGRNGAGKTTLLKLLLGLLPTQAGKIILFEQQKYRHEIFFHIGNMIEVPALYDHLTVVEHLKMLNLLYKQRASRIDDVLDMVGLTNEKNKKAAKLSTGLRQRLALAIALFHDPELLILDEPTNGMDPLGIIEVRKLLLQLQQAGKTIVLSSPIVSEMEKLCSHIGILENGELKYQGSPNALGAQTMEQFYLDILQAKAQ